jgi:hypothetical protein
MALRLTAAAAGGSTGAEPQAISTDAGATLSGARVVPIRTVSVPRAPVGLLVALGLALIVVPNVLGFGYYLATQSERVRSPLHAWFRPSGLFGQSAGIVSFALFLFLWLYPLRKRFPALSFLGPQAKLLDLHIVAGILIPVLAATHAAWRFSGIIGLGFAAMLVVSLSGVVGRYVYTRMPRSKSGVLLGLEEVAAERQKLLGDLHAATGLGEEDLSAALRVVPPPDSNAGVWGTFRQLRRDDQARRRAARDLQRTLSRGGAKGGNDRAWIRGVLRLARREMALQQQFQMIERTQRVFRFWHVAHLPVAITALLAVALHVVLAVAMGATWLR